MNSRKLYQMDSNNNEFSENESKKLSLVSITKKNKDINLAPISSTSTVSSVSFSSLPNEKENHFITSTATDACVPISNEYTKDTINSLKDNNTVKYGELVVLGYNGCITQPIKPEEISKQKTSYSINSKRRKSKFQLEAKDKPSGVKPSTQYNCHTKQDLNNLISKNENHSVTYTLSRTHQVIVQYVPDEKTDMFQIGRSTESAIDFIVLDTKIPQYNNKEPEFISSLAKTTKNTENNSANQVSNGQSTISRYSCRISIEREYPYNSRIYAAGFDSTKRIFLGEKATKWKNAKEEFDGVTTNGVLIMHPMDGGFEYNNETKYTNEWMEVSVCGAVFNLDENRLTPCLNINNAHLDSSQSGLLNNKDTKSNILRDGTLIDLCGATLLWRSIDSLKHSPTKKYIEMNLEYLNGLRPQCPVGFRTLVFPSCASPSSTSHLPSNFLANNILLSNNNENSVKSKFSSCNHNNRIVKPQKSSNKNSDRIPMVYLKCGHIHGQHDWGVKKDNERECPLCRNIGPYVQLLVGIEPSFYCEKNFKNNQNNIPFKPYAFLPCGHMAGEETCRYWSKIKIPQGVTQGLSSLCPFCAVPLCKDQPIVKLILQEGC